jgi:DNA-binding transcriptional LysR family regulator
MELRQLEHFVAVAEERSFTRAARRLYIVQSAVSASIRALERDLQAELFTRTTQRVSLTDAGAMLLPQARRILAEVSAARELVADVHGGLRGTLTIGTMQGLTAGAIDIALLLGEFRTTHPLLEIRLHQAAGGSAELAERVRDGRMDLAFLSLPDRRSAAVALTPLASEEMVIVCSADHPLAARKAVSLATVADEPFIDHPPGWGTRDSIDRAFTAARLQRSVAFEVNDTSSVLNLVRNGLGVAFLPPALVLEPEGVRIVPVRGHAPLWEVSLATPSNRPLTAAARAFAAAATGAGAERSAELAEERDGGRFSTSLPRSGSAAPPRAGRPLEARGPTAYRLARLGDNPK